MSAIDYPRARAAMARLEALAATAEGADACMAISAELRREEAAMGRAGAADMRQLVLPLTDAANDDTEGADGE